MFKTKQCAKCKTGALSYQLYKYLPACYYLASYNKKDVRILRKLKEDQKTTFLVVCG